MTRLICVLVVALTGCAVRHPVPAVTDPGLVKLGLANNVIYLFGWPAMIGVHVAFVLLVIGAWKHYRAEATA